MIDMIDTALRRAARRTPTQAAMASVQALQALREYQAQVRAASLPELAPLDGPLRIIPGEYWCLACGNAGIPVASTEVSRPQHCYTCGSERLAPAVAVLRAGEYDENLRTDGNKVLPSVLAADNETNNEENHG